MTNRFSPDPVVDAAYEYLETLNDTLADILENQDDLKDRLLNAMQQNLHAKLEPYDGGMYSIRATQMQGCLSHLRYVLFPEQFD